MSDNPPCCNPAHWFAGTNQSNVDDRQAKGRGVAVWGLPLLNSRKTHCNRGHEFTPENTRIYQGNQRRCKACEPINSREWYHNKKAENEGR